MPRTFFQDFTRDNGVPITVEYSATGGEPDFDHPGHICDGGGSGPEIVILKAWPNTPGHERLAAIDLKLWLNAKTQLERAVASVIRLPIRGLLRLDEWWRASLGDEEREKFEAWLAEHYVEEPYDDYDY